MAEGNTMTSKTQSDSISIVLAPLQPHLHRLRHSFTQLLLGDWAVWESTQMLLFRLKCH